MVLQCNRAKRRLNVALNHVTIVHWYDPLRVRFSLYYYQKLVSRGAVLFVSPNFSIPTPTCENANYYFLFWYHTILFFIWRPTEQLFSSVHQSLMQNSIDSIRMVVSRALSSSMQDTRKCPADSFWIYFMKIIVWRESEI